MAHGVAEVAGECSVIFEGFLELARRAGNGCGDLIPVLRGELARAVDLDEGERDLLERLFRAARDGVDVSGRFGHLVEVFDAVRGELRRHRLNIRQVVHRLIGVGLSGGGQLLDPRRVNAREFERLLELVGRVGRRDRCGDLRRERGRDAADRRGDAAEAELAD